MILQARRSAVNAIYRVPKLKKGDPLPHLIHQVSTKLRPTEDPAEYRLTLGKIQNLRLAAKKLNGIVLPAGETFSFWSVLGRLTTWRGYVVGREIREGCLIPNVGGGICQLSNALYQAALQIGCEIIERHPHTIAVPGSDAGRDQDATVAWNDIDLRFRATETMQIECRLTSDHLIVGFRTAAPAPPIPTPRKQTPLHVIGMKSCATCGENRCSRHSPELRLSGDQQPTWLMNAAWPEWIGLHQSTGGRLIVPRQDAWPNAETVPIAAAIRSLRARLARGKPPAHVRRTLLQGDVLVAEAIGRRLTYLDDELIVALSLLAPLWSSSYLAGRRFRVVLDRAPLAVLHELLDDAALREPESPTLADFRADEWLVAAEEEALAAAAGVTTTHHGLAARFPGARVLDWDQPLVQAIDRRPERMIVFPGPAVARHGSKAVREVARRLDLSVMILGTRLEDVRKWDGINLLPTGDWKSRALAVVQPSVFETRPQKLLHGLAAGVPIIASSQCGLPYDACTTIEFGDIDELEGVLRKLVATI